MGVPALGRWARTWDKVGPLWWLQPTAPCPFPWLHLPAGASLGHTEGGSLVPLGWAEAGAMERDGTKQSPSEPPARAGQLGTESCPPPRPRTHAPAGSVSPSGCRSRAWAALGPVSGPLRVCTCDCNLVAQTQTPECVHARGRGVCRGCVLNLPWVVTLFFSPSCLAVTWGRLIASLCGGC